MGGYLYKYINNDSGDVVYVGKSNNQFTLINRLHTHNTRSAWSINTTVEFAAVPREFDLSVAETAAINYYYIHGITENINQVGDVTKEEAKEQLERMKLRWITIDINHILPDENLPRPGGMVVCIDHGVLTGIYIITQIVHTSRGLTYKLYSPDYCKTPIQGLTYYEMSSTSKYHYWTPELFDKLAQKYGWNDVDY